MYLTHNIGSASALPIIKPTVYFYGDLPTLINNNDKTYGIFLRGFANLCAVSNRTERLPKTGRDRHKKTAEDLLSNRRGMGTCVRAYMLDTRAPVYGCVHMPKMCVI